MKRIGTLVKILPFALALSLCACGGGGDNSGQQQNGGNNSQPSASTGAKEAYQADKAKLKEKKFTIVYDLLASKSDLSNYEENNGVEKGAMFAYLTCYSNDGQFRIYYFNEESATQTAYQFNINAEYAVPENYMAAGYRLIQKSGDLQFSVLLD